MEPVRYQRLLPAGEPITAPDLIHSLPLEHSEDAGLPYTVVNLVLSADGHIAVGEQSRKLSDGGDRELFRMLRERADAVLAGTGTLAAEQYGRMLPAAERRQRRVTAGRSAEPLAVTVARSNRLPERIPLFSEPEARVVIFSPTDPRLSSAAQIHHHPFGQHAELADALRTLRANHGVRMLLCEGGPTLFAALLRAGLVDELFFTLAPALVGGWNGPAVASGPPLKQSLELTLVGLLEREGSLFLRYRPRRPLSLEPR